MDAETKAAAAKRLLGDPLLTEALGAIRAEAIVAWTGTSAKDTEAREIAWITVKVLDRITGELENIIASGKIAAKRIQAPLR